MKKYILVLSTGLGLFNASSFAKCKIHDITNSPQNLKCTVLSGEENRKIDLTCENIGNGRTVEVYQVRVNEGSPEVVNNTYYQPVKKGAQIPLVFEMNSGTLKLTSRGALEGFLVEHKTHGRTWVGNCRRLSY